LPLIWTDGAELVQPSHIGSTRRSASSDERPGGRGDVSVESREGFGREGDPEGPREACLRELLKRADLPEGGGVRMILRRQVN